MEKIDKPHPRLERFVATLLLGILFIAAAGSRPRAAEDSYGGFSYYFHLDHLEIAPDHCDAAATISYDGVLSHMSMIRDEWLSKENTTEHYQRHTLAIIFGVVDHKVGGVLLQTVYVEYRAKKPDKCHFSLSLAKIDDFGQVKSYPQLSWDFSAALASRIVWDRFDDRNLPKIASNYKFSAEADRLLKEENAEPAGATAADAPDYPRSCSDISAFNVAEVFNNSPYAQGHHLKVLDATNPKPLPQRANRGFACISKLVTNGGTLNVIVEPKLLNGTWYVSVVTIP